MFLSMSLLFQFSTRKRAYDFWGAASISAAFSPVKSSCMQMLSSQSPSQTRILEVKTKLTSFCIDRCAFRAPRFGVREKHEERKGREDTEENTILRSDAARRSTWPSQHAGPHAGMISPFGGRCIPPHSDLTLIMKCCPPSSPHHERDL